MCYLDTDTKELKHIVNDKKEFARFYAKYKNQIWVGYNSRHYDQWIAKAILCDFDPYEMNDWLINKGEKGFMFSKLLNNFPILNYDAMVGFRGLKELEAFMGIDIQETQVPFDIDRKLTSKEIQEVIKYCNHDVMSLFEVFIETSYEFESHIGLIEEFKLPYSMVSKTKAQISAEILGATQRKWDDEFDISLPDNLELGKYSHIYDYYMDWAKNVRDYKKIKYEIDICGVPHTFGVGGLHGCRNKYIGEGHYILADVSSYYPRAMVEYEYLSRNVANPKKFETILDERLEMKAVKDPRENPRKIVLNSTFGASKDMYNKLYDPRQANNLTIANQLFLVDLLEKLEGHCEIIQSNTDGILFKLFNPEDKEKLIGICSEWEKRTGFTMDYKEFRKVIQPNVNNYIIIGKDGYIERIGTMFKKLSRLDNDLPIVNRALVEYFVHGTPVRDTIMASNEMIDFQKVTKVTRKYSHAVHNGRILSERVHRCFASRDTRDGTLFKKHAETGSLQKTAGTPEKCRVYNGDVRDMVIPNWLDRQWYVDLALERVTSCY